MERRNNLGVYVVLGLFVFFTGMYVANRPVAEVAAIEQRNPLDTLAEIIQHPVCATPLLILMAVGTVLVLPHIIRAFVDVVLHIQREKATIEELKVHVEQSRKQVSGTQLVEDERGRQVMVNPALATRPVTLVDGEGELDSEQLRAARMLSEALKSANLGHGTPSADMLALAFGGGRMMPMEERIQPEIRVLTADEIESLA